MAPVSQNLTFRTGLLLGLSACGALVLHLIVQIIFLTGFVPGFVTTWLLLSAETNLALPARFPTLLLACALPVLPLHVALRLRSPLLRPPEAVIGYGLMMGACGGAVLDRLMHGAPVTVAYIFVGHYKFPFNLVDVFVLLSVILLLVSLFARPRVRRETIADLKRFPPLRLLSPLRATLSRSSRARPIRAHQESPDSPRI